MRECKMGRELFLFVISLSLSGTITGGILFLVKPIVKRYFSKTWQYYIWLIFFLRFLLLVTTEINLVDQIFSSNSSENLSDANLKEEVLSGEDLLKGDLLGEEISRETSSLEENYVSTKEDFLEKQDVAKQGQNGIYFYLCFVWIVGILISFLWQVLSYQTLIRKLKKNSCEIVKPEVLEVFCEVKTKLKIKRKLRVYETSAVLSPMLLGVIRPMVFLPTVDIPLTDLRMILTHELIHEKRKDLLYKWFCQLVRWIYWFHPLLYFVNQEVGRMCELSCDEMVIRHLNKEERQTYGQVLLRAAERAVEERAVMSMNFLKQKKNLKERLEHIMKYRTMSKAAAAVSVVFAVMLTASAVVVGAKTLPISSSKLININHVLETITIGEQYLKESIGDSKKTNDKEEYERKVKEANLVYDDTAKIAGEDILLHYSSTSFIKRKKYSYQARELQLHGSDTYIIYDMKTSATVEMIYLTELVSGKFKIVLVDPKNQVTNLAEGTGSGTKTISLKQGRNRIKLVGNQAYLYQLSINLSEVDEKKVNAVYDSEEAEQEAKRAKEIIQEIKKDGRIDLDKLVAYAPKLEEEILSNVFIELLKSEKSMDQTKLKEIIPYLDTDILEDYFYDLLKKKTKIEFYVIEPLLPYLNEEFLMEYFLCSTKQEQNLMEEQKKKLLCYSGEYLGEYLLDRYAQGKESLENILEYLNEMDEDVLTDTILELLKTDAKRAVELLKKSYFNLDEDEIYQCLLEAINQKVKLTKSELLKISSMMDQDDFYEILIKFNDKKLIIEE